MRILKNTLEPVIDSFDDPGDYPSNAGAGPLPSYDYFAGVEGELVLELTDEEMADFQADQKEFLDNADILLPEGILSVEWQVDKVEGNRVEVSVTEAEPDPDYCVHDEPEYDPVEEWERRHREN